MSMLGRAVRSAVRSAYWKCRFGGRIRVSPVEGFDHVHLEMASGGEIRLGTRIQNRGYLYFQCGPGGQLQVGSHVFFNTGSSVACMGRTQIGDYCKFGNNTVIVDHDHNYKDENGEYLTGEIHIGNRVWVGANCTILQGARIGDDCVIAAGSVVKGNIPPGTMFYQRRENCCKAAE